MKKPYDHTNVTDEDFGKKFYELIKSDSDEFIQKYIPKTFLFRYFLNYLKFEKNGLQIKTIISENDYTCLNFLDDYANYYARCYTLYKKHCKRIHFFEEEFKEEEFSQMLRDPEHEYWKKYAGCMVIKPLPKGIFGITLLKTYEQKDGRHYVCLSEKTINLFGHDCKIKTMPFKEQDGKVASCATTALWMAFQKTSELFNTKAPSLSEVTILAGDGNSNSGKIFPSKGLAINQVCKAIYKNGLMSEFRTDLTSLCFFKGLVYAYLKGDIPVLLGLRLPTDDECHLVTVNGYRLASPQNGEVYASDEIIRFYAHDDQVGPFARLLINSGDCTITNDEGQEIEYDYSLTTSWCKKAGQLEWQNNVFIKTLDSNNKENPDSFVLSTPEYVIIPISPVIKVTYEDILVQQGIIDFVLGSFTDIENKLTWDIFINKSNDYKKWLLKKEIIGESSQIMDILTTSLPQYIWTVRAWSENTLLFDFIYDSVELNTTGQPVAINVYNNDFLELLKDEKMIDVRCSHGFFMEKYKDSLMRRMNELPQELAMEKWFEKPVCGDAKKGTIESTKDLHERFIDVWGDTKKGAIESLMAYLPLNDGYVSDDVFQAFALV